MLSSSSFFFLSELAKYKDQKGGGGRNGEGYGRWRASKDKAFFTSPFAQGQS